MRDNINDMMSEFSEMETEGQLISVVPADEDDSAFDEMEHTELPVLPLRNAVLFPGVVIPITVGREKSVKLVQEAYDSSKVIGVVAQRSSKKEDPAVKDLYKVGTIARIIKTIKLPDGNTTIIIQGKRKFAIDEVVTEDPYMVVKASVINDDFAFSTDEESEALVASLKEAAYRILELNKDIPDDARIALDNIDSLGFLVNFLSSNLNVEVKVKQKLLEIKNGREKVTTLLEYMFREIQMLELKNEIASKVNQDIDQQQRDYFLRQQMRVLQDELGVEGPERDALELEKRAAKKDWPETAAEHFDKELQKLKRLNPAAAEYPIALSYCEFLLDLPWYEATEDKFDLKQAQKILDNDHYGLDHVKDRIIEYLAVLKLTKDMKGPILCLYGPPGVGKTSLGKSIAKALGRKYVRMALGGVKDESEIRGHRKTYVGAMPGKVLQNLKKVNSSNPVFVLDEIDKVSADFRGDPSSALLEVLDPEQNSAFADNYLEVDYDLSNVLFIATANNISTIQPALLDRMEMIEVTGYSVEEKIEIAKKHLIPKQRKLHGLTAKDISFDNKSIRALIEGYTRESGVRSLERTIGTVIRKVAKSVAMEEEYQKKMTPKEIERLLKTPSIQKEVYQDNETAGVVTGLAWTSVGGEILFIESSLSRGKGRLTLSGQLGDVMKESATTALSYLKANADKLGIDHRLFEQYDLHLHVPAGAVPKDGPSAGITMLTSIASIYTQRKVKANLAMTGEITLRGKVLPVGGIKEKFLAARRAGIKEVIFSERNRPDVEMIDEQYTKGIKIHFVDMVAEVLDIALTKQKVKDPMSLELK
ncbi:endopeptidase La [Algivirga pacifica]|uniref:Lon protease n=1 Tax=Algivirga pacifica TaxID=1162670 RepID=A0ABP9CX17_9BACT